MSDAAVNEGLGKMDGGAKSSKETRKTKSLLGNNLQDTILFTTAQI